MVARKLLASVVVLATGLLGTAACGGGGSEDRDSGGNVTMTFWHNATTGDGKAFWEKTVADFQAANPNVKIEIQASRTRTLTASSRPRSTPATRPTSSSSAAAARWRRWSKAGQLMDITGSITDETKKVISAGSFTAQTIDGKVYAMPVAVLPGGFFYSKDLFTKAGISQPPTTLAELQAAVDKLKARASSRSPWAPRTPGRRRTATTSSRCASAARTTVARGPPRR